MRLSTFSIVGCDLEAGEWGVAVASKFLAAGAVVSWARADAGAVATQALAKVGYGPDGLALLAEGRSAAETLEALVDPDEGKAERQIGLVDRNGEAAAHTGEKCIDWAGHRVGEHYACQGNILTGPETLEAMATTYETAEGVPLGSARGEPLGTARSELADRLVAALRAGDEVGGDRRGKQSAAVLVVREGGGYGGDNDRYLDLRVDDHPDPVGKLIDLVAMHHVFFGPTSANQLVPIDSTLAKELQELCTRLGYYSGEIDGKWGEQSKAAFWALIGQENLEERWSLDQRNPDVIDGVALDYLRRRFAVD